MTISALIVGRLIADPEQRTSANGKAYVRAKLSAATDDGESAFVSVTAFGGIGDRLAALAKGASVAIAGRCRVRAWLQEGEAKAGLDVVVDELLSEYHVRQRRAAMADRQEGNTR